MLQSNIAFCPNSSIPEIAAGDNPVQEVVRYMWRALSTRWYVDSSLLTDPLHVPQVSDNFGISFRDIKAHAVNQYQQLTTGERKTYVSDLNLQGIFFYI